MKICPFCQKEVSEDATICPYCGKMLSGNLTVNEISDTANTPDAKSSNIMNGDSDLLAYNAKWRKAYLIYARIFLGLLVAMFVLMITAFFRGGGEPAAIFFGAILTFAVLIVTISQYFAVRLISVKGDTNTFFWLLPNLIPFALLIIIINYTSSRTLLLYHRSWISFLLTSLFPLLFYSTFLALLATRSKNLTRQITYIAIGIWFLGVSPTIARALNMGFVENLNDLKILPYLQYVVYPIAGILIAWGMIELIFKNLAKYKLVPLYIALALITLIAFTVVRDKALADKYINKSSFCTSNYLNSSPEKIVFKRGDNLFAVNSDGTGEMQVSNIAKPKINYYISRSLSPDGKYLAYVEMTDPSGPVGMYGKEIPGWALHRVNLTTGENKVLYQTAPDTAEFRTGYKWSSSDELSIDLAIITKDQLKNRDYNNTSLSFDVNGNQTPGTIIAVESPRKKTISPNGLYKLESTSKGTTTAYYIMKTNDEKSAVRLPNGTTYLRWFNDSKKIVARSKTGLVVMDICGNIKQITNNPTNEDGVEQ